MWISGIAASVVLLFGIYFFSNQSLSPNELFETYFKIYPNAYTIKGSSSEKSLSKKAFAFYDATKYQLAVETFEKLLLIET